MTSRQSDETAPPATGTGTELDTKTLAEAKATAAPDATNDTEADDDAGHAHCDDPVPEAVPSPEADVAATPVDEHAPGPAPPPAPSPPEAAAPCKAGLFGKLPARGDFISRAVAQDLLRPIEDWLLPLVQATRELLGTNWEAAWRQAPPWRFWIGPDILRGDWTRNLRAKKRQKPQFGAKMTVSKLQ